MSLNDNVLDDIYSGDVTLLDDGDTSMKTMTQNINTIIKNSPSPVEDPLLNRIVTADANLTNLDNTFGSLCEKKNIQDDIVAIESISRNEAILVNEVFGNLIKPTLSLEEFTTFNSKTNYEFTLRHMQRTISIEEEQFLDGHKVFLRETLNDVCSVLEKIQEDYIPKIIEQGNNLKYLNGNLYNTLTSNKDLVLPYADGFKNITTISLFELEPDLIKLNIANRDSFKKTVILFRQLMSIKEINSFLDVLQLMSLEPLDKDNNGILERTTTILDLAKMVQEVDIEKIINELNKRIQRNILNIDQIKKNETNIIDNFELIKINFIDMKIDSSGVISESSKYVSLITNLSTLFQTIEDLFEYTKQF